MNFSRSPALLKIERIRHLLLREYMTIPEIAVAIPLSETNVRLYVRHLQAQKQIFIYEWRQVERKNGQLDWVAAFAWGDASDAVRPRIKDRAAYYRKKYHARRANDPMGHQLYLSRKRMSKWKPHCDMAASWIPRKT